MFIKSVIAFVPAFISFMLIDVNSLGWVFFVAVASAGFNYLLADLYFLNFGDTIASIGSGITGGVIAYATGLATAAFNPTAGALISFAILVAIGESVFHPYLMPAKRSRS